jgi:GH24 family phage-related lysozyme (muramidase)
MKHLRTYEEYKENLLLEKLDIKNLFNKFKKSKNKQIAKMIVIGLLGIYSFTQANNFIKNQELDVDSINLLTDELKKIDSLKNDKIKSIALQDSLEMYKKPTTMVLSQDGWDQIRMEEGSSKQKGEPVLTAYKLGDNMITIGYGHAEPIRSSKYKVGDKITKEKANELLIKDVNDAASGVKRMFAQWEEEGIDIRLTQAQYDVLVSLAFNKGIGAFRKSAFIQSLKKGDYVETAEKIKAEGDTTKFAGVKSRRVRESKKFLSTD